MAIALLKSAPDIAKAPVPFIDAHFVSVCSRHDVFAHGAAIAVHGGKFYATFGRNEGLENSVGEHTVCFVSDDGEAWRFHSVMGGMEEQVARSHGILFEQGSRLWAYNAVFYGTVQPNVPNTGGGYYPGLCVEGYYLDDESDEWVPVGRVAEDFWPLNQPEPIGGGKYIIPGTSKRWLSAYLIGSVETGWQKFDTPIDFVRYTETACLVSGQHIRLLMRNSRRDIDMDKRYLACAASEDGGASWQVGETALYDNDSKPAAITLSNGVKCIIGNRLAQQGFSRAVLCIAYTAPGSDVFSGLRIIRDQHIPAQLAELYAPQTEQGASAYPYCMEHDGKLYIIYSSCGTDGLPNHNRIELAVLNIDSLTDAPCVGM